MKAPPVASPFETRANGALLRVRVYAPKLATTTQKQLALRQESDHRVGEGVRLLDV